MTSVGLVAIGRNEGERLQRCLQSVQGRFARIVYVDSGSTDGSQQVAQALGAEVVALDTSAPFTAARARNAGFAQLMQSMPELEYVQFIDGDCELDPAWPQQALQHMVSHERIAVICGRRRERYPERSVYNHLCDIEWNGPIGRVASCGGDAMVRVRAFDQVGGYDPALIAGEEPDMCYRMAAKGWEIWRLDAAMTLHDAAMTSFGQWWRRSIRSGHAAAEALSRRGLDDVAAAKRVVSNVFWSMPFAWPIWPILAWRVYRKRGDLAYAASIVVGKLPHMQGQIKFWFGRLSGKRFRLIEYK